MLLTDQTLAQQLKLTDRRIEERKKLFRLTEEDTRNLLTAKPYIESKLDHVIDAFYQQQLRHSEVQLVIGDAETMERLKKTLKTYILEMFSGVYDSIYVNSRLRVGKIHKRIGVPPALYMSAVQILWSILQDIIEDHCDDGTCSRLEVEERKKSLAKILMFDVHFIFETYTDALVAEVQVARNDMEKYAEDLEEAVASRTLELENLSRQDGLTGLLNQRAFFEHLRLDLAYAKRRQESLTLIYFDLNGFKQLNDTRGHREGDKVLAHVGEVLLATVREVDTACRYGGDEFCVIFPNSVDESIIRLCHRLVQRFEAKAGEYNVSFSIGILQVGPEEYPFEEDIVKEADQRMYKAKKASKKVSGYWYCIDEPVQIKIPNNKQKNNVDNA
ncbi:GGDEF domain-containing protein [Magnetococcales bacterium HHB-1]